MSRLALMTAIMALAAVDLSEVRDERPVRSTTTAAGDPPQDDIDPQAEQVRREARERRRQNFLKRQK